MIELFSYLNTKRSKSIRIKTDRMAFWKTDSKRIMKLIDHIKSNPDLFYIQCFKVEYDTKDNEKYIKAFDISFDTDDETYDRLYIEYVNIFEKYRNEIDFINIPMYYPNNESFSNLSIFITLFSSNNLYMTKQKPSLKWRRLCYICGFRFYCLFFFIVHFQFWNSKTHRPGSAHRPASGWGSGSGCVPAGCTARRWCRGRWRRRSSYRG